MEMFGIDVDHELFVYRFEVVVTKKESEKEDRTYRLRKFIHMVPPASFKNHKNLWFFIRDCFENNVDYFLTRESELVFDGQPVLGEMFFDFCFPTEIVLILNDLEKRNHGALVPGLALAEVIPRETQKVIYRELLTQAYETGEDQNFSVTFTLRDMARVYDPNDNLGLELGD